jgi:predicted DNA-binding protein (UPF0251 family)
MIIQTYPVRLALSDAVRIDAAAESMGCTVDLLLREAADQKRLLYVALAPYSATLRAVPSHEAPRAGSQETKQPQIVALAAHYAKSLSIFGNVNVEQWQASFDGGVLDWHCWRLDVPQHVTPDHVFVWQVDVDSHKQNEHGAAQQAKKNLPRRWDEHDLNRLLDESRGPDMTQEKLAQKYGVSRQAIAKQLKKTEKRGSFSKAVTAFTGLGARSRKK